MRSSIGILLCPLFLASSLVVEAASQARAVPDTSRGGELTAADWAGIQRAHDESLRAVRATAEGLQARHSGQQWRIDFDGQGFTVTPDAPGWTWGLQLQSYGFAGGTPVGRPDRVSSAGCRVAYDWDDCLQEWYVNDERGLEHGYTLSCRPWGADGPMTLVLAVRGGLAPRVRPDGLGAVFVDGAGALTVTYDGLIVTDADGRAVAARFRAESGALVLEIDERDARYPLTIDPWAQQAYLKASNPGTNDNFSSSLCISGDTVVVGAFNESSDATGVDGDQTNDDATSSGAAYVFVRTSTFTWVQQAYLKASNTGASDKFGRSVSIDGDTIVVGANEEDSNATGVNGNQANNSAGAAGAAYVFVRNGTTWTQQAYLKASNTASGDQFGTKVSISGNTVCVAATGEDSAATGVGGNQADNSASQSGAVYVFVRSGTTWSQQAYIKASNTETTDQFGDSMAVSGDILVVGTHFEDSSATGIDGDGSNNGASNSGAAWVFARSGTTWSQQAYLKSSNSEAFDFFGWSVAVSGETIVVGAENEPGGATGVNGNEADDSVPASGAAYVFVRSGSTWSQQAYLKASNTDIGDSFGASVAVSGDLAVVGAPNELSDATGVDGDQSDDSVQNAGAAYVFARNGTSWSQQAYLKPSQTQINQRFGSDVSASGIWVSVGAFGEHQLGALIAGAAYIFYDGPWTNLGHGLAGATAAPKLSGTGTLEGGTFVTTTVHGLVPNSFATLVLGLSPINAPFKGGVWVPALDILIVGIPTGPIGSIDLPTTWPMGFPPGFSIYEQYWQQNPTGPAGFTASNALQGTTP